MPQRRQPVPIEELEGLLHVRSSKWTLSIILRLRRQTMRFTELQRDIGNVSQKTLTATLRVLERDGFISRTSYPTIPPRVDYALTDLGVEALRVFEAWERFALAHWPRVVESRAAFDAMQATRQGVDGEGALRKG